MNSKNIRPPVNEVNKLEVDKFEVDELEFDDIDVN